MTFTFDDFLTFLRGRGMERLAYLMQKYESTPEVADLKGMLPKLGARLLEKGLIQAPTEEDRPVGGAAASEFSPSEQRAIPYLAQLDEELKRGGHDAALAMWSSLMKDPQARGALLEVAL